MRLTVVGCSGSFPGPDSPASCYLLEHGRERVLLDVGNGALGPLQRHVDLDTLTAVLVSHLHVDHVVDLCSLYVARRYRPAGPLPRLRVIGPAGTREQVARAYGTSPVVLDAVFAFEAHRPEAQVGDLTVRSERVAHPVEAYGLRLEADGRVLAYSGDTGPCGGVRALASGADLLLAEASFLDGEPNPPDLHLTGGEAGTLAHEAGVGRLVVTHVPPWHSRDRAGASAAAAYDGPVVVAEPGLILDV